MEATQWIPGASLGALGTSLRDSLSSVVSSCHAGSGSSGQSAALSSSRLCSKRPSTDDGTPIRGGSKWPRHDVGSQGTPSNSAGNSDGPSNSAGGGVSTGNIITGFTGSTGTGSINMPTVKEAKILELNCPQWERTNFLITLLTSGVTVSASIHTAVELDDLTPISEFEQNHGMDTVHLSIDSGCWFLKTL